jgi:branched-chain amino acid transport system ATP-binding protein/branched-chain amino acid transport system permease protein
VSALAADRAQATLEAVDVAKSFGGVHALRGVSMRLAEREIVGLIGPNGSGKTTLLNCIAGVYAPTSGRLLLDGSAFEGRPGHRVARSGIVRTFQNIRLFAKLSVIQNVEISALATKQVTRGRSSEYARALLDELGIAALAEREAGTLSYGDQRRLEIARALAAGPRFLLLDEPAAGMNEAESEALRPQIERVRANRGCGVLVVDHDLRLIMQLCDRIYVLNEGEVIATGTPAEVRRDPAVIAAYVGDQDYDERGDDE